MNKKGLEIAVTTVIMIILSIAILTILIIFVNSQTGFFSRWLGTQQGESNVDFVVTGCNGLVATESVYSYCCDKREVVLGGKGEVDDDGNVVEKNFKMTCDVARGEGWAGGRIGELSCVGVECSV